MSTMRREYFKDVLQDARQVCEELGIEPEDQGAVIAALIQSDSLNGLRKAILTPNYIVAQNGARNFAATPQSNPQY